MAEAHPTGLDPAKQKPDQSHRVSLASASHALERQFPIFKFDDVARSHQHGRHSKKLQMQGARILRSEAYTEVRRNDLPC